MRTVCMDGQCLKKIPVSSSEWVEELSQFKKDFKKKIMMKIVIRDIFLNIQKFVWSS